MSVTTCVMSGLGRFDIAERPVREPGLHEVLVDVRSVGICGSDVAYFTRGRIGPWVVDGPLVLGHEAAGIVAGVGQEVTRVAVGDRVALEPGTPCRRCRECRRGDYHLCPHLVFLATPPHDGALAEQLVVDELCANPIPGQMSYDEAALVEPLSVGLWACHRAGLRPGDEVLVTGAGPVGILAGLAARALGAGAVTLVDVAQERLDLAASLGLSVEHDADGSRRHVDVLIECSANEAALVGGLRRLGPGGRAALVGVPKSDLVGLPLGDLVAQEVTVSLVHRYAHTWPTAIELIVSGRVPTEGIVTHHFGLDRSADAFELHQKGRSAIKIMIHPTQD